MKIIEFIENRYQELTLKQSSVSQDKFNLSIDSEIQTVAMLLRWTRKTTQFLMIPKVIFHYFGVVVGLAKRPQPVLVNKAKADQQAELEKKAKKVGMLQMVENKQSDELTPA